TQWRWRCLEPVRFGVHYAWHRFDVTKIVYPVGQVRPVDPFSVGTHNGCILRVWCLQSFRQNLFPPGCAAGCESLGLYPRLQRFVPIRQAYLTLMIIWWGSLGLGMRPGWVDALARWAHVRCVADRWLVPGR